MARPVMSLARVVALSVAFTLAAGPAVAQMPASGSNWNVASLTPLLSDAAFVRLAPQYKTAAALVSVGTPFHHIDLRRQALASALRPAPQGQTAPAPAPTQRNWFVRHKVLVGFLLGAGVLVGGLVVACQPQNNAWCSGD